MMKGKFHFSKLGVVIAVGAMTVSLIALKWAQPHIDQESAVGETWMAKDKQAPQPQAATTLGMDAPVPNASLSVDPQPAPPVKHASAPDRGAEKIDPYTARPGEVLSDLGAWARWCTIRQYGPSEKVKEPCEFLVKNTPGLLLALGKQSERTDPKAGKLTADDWVSEMMARGALDEAEKTRLVDSINVWWARLQ